MSTPAEIADQMVIPSGPWDGSTIIYEPQYELPFSTTPQLSPPRPTPLMCIPHATSNAITRTTSLFTSPISAPPTMEPTGSKIFPISIGNQISKPSDAQASNANKYTLASNDNVDQSHGLNFTQTDYNASRQTTILCRHFGRSHFGKYFRKVLYVSIRPMGHSIRPCLDLP